MERLNICKPAVLFIATESEILRTTYTLIRDDIVDYRLGFIYEYKKVDKH